MTDARTLRRLTFGSFAALVAATAPEASIAQPATTAGVTVFADDTLTLLRPEFSADGRWIIVANTKSNDDATLLIRSTRGGAFRVLDIPRGFHVAPRLTPAGDRLVFLSSLPRRNASDAGMYLVSVPFDIRSGTVTGVYRQLSLDNVRAGGRVTPAMSPDGKWVAYVECCEVNGIRIVPVAGGNARTVTSGAANVEQLPGRLRFSTDSRFLGFQMVQAGNNIIHRVATTGGTPTVVARLGAVNVVALSPTLDLVALVKNDGKELVVSTMGGRVEASWKLARPLYEPEFARDGRSITGREDLGRNSMKLLDVASGQVRRFEIGDVSGWPESWAADGSRILVSGTETGGRTRRVITISGATEKTAPHLTSNMFAVHGNEGLSYEVMGAERDHVRRVVSTDLRTGRKRVIATGVQDVYITRPGGWYGVADGRLYYAKRNGAAVDLYSHPLDDTARKLLTVPEPAARPVSYAVGGAHAAWTEARGDSVHLFVASSTAKANVLLRVPKNADPSYVFSHDGRSLAVSLSAPSRILIYRFANGAVTADPKVVAPEFQYQYELMWSPDGNVLSMIAQPKDAPYAGVAIFRMNDLKSPQLVTGSERANVWGHIWSPDGRQLAIPVETGHGAIVHRFNLPARGSSKG